MSKAVDPERQRCIEIAVGCLDYLGGYRGADLTVYHHGIQTVINALSGDQSTYQLRVVAAMGREAVEMVEVNRQLLESLRRAHLVTCPTVDPIHHTCGGCSISEVIARAEGK